MGIKSVVRDTALYRGLAKPLRDELAVRRWVGRGRPVPPPPAFKQRLVRDYAARYSTKVLVESGTAAGEMVSACLTAFDSIYSIELDPRACERARRRFAKHPHVKVLEGDSGELLPSLFGRISEPCLFWLDGHAMVGSVTGRRLTPVREELSAILGHSVERHVVLIDDARLFEGRGDYPSLAEVEETVRSSRPGWRLETEYDVVRIVPG